MNNVETKESTIHQVRQTLIPTFGHNTIFKRWDNNYILCVVYNTGGVCLSSILW
jgi:hypothetical protein